MSEEKQGTANNSGFEQEDMSPLGIFYFMAGLAIVGVVIYFILVGMYRFLDAYDREHQAPVNPMAIKTGIDQTMNPGEIRQKAEATFPKPVLEYSEQTQFIKELGRQDETLASYDWVDQKAGIVRIPIDRAIDLVAERGLPVLPAGAAAEAAAGAKAVIKTRAATNAPAPK
jgi:hypothetical protein